MAKGKKKGNKKEADEPSTQKTSVSEEQPSTSTQEAPQEEEEGLGLGGGRKKKQKQKTTPAVAGVGSVTTVVEPEKMPAAPIPPETKKDEVQEIAEDFDGLGIGGGKKRNRKKKTGPAEDTPVQTDQSSTSSAQQVASRVSSTPTQPPMSTPAPPPAFGWQPTAAAGRGSAGRGQTAGRGQSVGRGQSAGRGGQQPPGLGHPVQKPGQPQGPLAGWGQPPQQPGQPQGPPAGRGQPLQQGQPQMLPPGWGQPPQQPGQPQGPPAGWGQPPQQPGQPQGPPAGWGQPPQQPGQPQGPPAGWGQPPQLQDQPQRPPPGWGQTPQQLSQPQAPPAGWGQPQQPSQPPPSREQTPQPAQAQPPRQQPSAPRPSPQPQPLTKYPAQQSVVCRYKIPLKIPGRTVRARPISVLTNYLDMTIQPYKIARYDVAFKPDKPKKMIPQVFKAVKEKFFPKEWIAFDQMKNCYCLKPLPIDMKNERFTTNVEVKDQNGKVMKFEVAIKPTGIVDLGKIISYMSSGGTSLCPPTEEIQCVDVILRQGTLESYIKAGRQFFKRPANPIDLGCGLEMWTGLFQSAIFTSRAFINVDVAHKGFPRNQPLVDAISRDFRMDPNQPLDRQRGIDNFLEFIKGLRVVAYLVGNIESAGQKRDFICNGLAEPPSRLSFNMTDAAGNQKKITVADYFAKEKKYRLKYPNLNCMWVGPRDKNIYFPIELLDVAYGQALNKQLNEMQLSKMVREAATKPDERMRKIYEVIDSVNYSRNEQFKKFGLNISDEFVEVKAKILDAPNLEVGEGLVMPKKGVWQANKLLRAEALKTWGFVAIETDPRVDYENMITLLLRTGTSMGMTVAQPMLRNFNATMRDLRPILFNALEKGINFLFIVVSTRGRDYYHRVKQMAECDVGILTQCVKENTVAMKMNTMTAKNILLKVNSKLMGINQALDGRNIPKCLKDGGVMIVGADVTHPSPDQSSIPSIAAVTASIDPQCYKYNIELSIQTPKKEMIVEFEDMMVDHLKIYMKNNMNHLPRKIFVFRDGVSEGQFAQVMNSELQAVHNAYQRMSGKPTKPEVLFLLVQKRHHTRFFQPRNTQYNVEPGTVVDSHIVHATELDFYLVSHQAIKGTARPTRYHSVCNDGKIPDDEVEQLTYYLCHLYSRCMRAVSYPTPTYYAHLACLRARSLTHGQKFDNNELERKPKRLRVLDKMLQFSRMFFV